MAYVWIFVGAALVLAVLGKTLGARYRRFDAVPDLANVTSRSGAPQNSVTMVARPETMTEIELERLRAYDGADDLLDPRNPRHAQWLAEHEPESAAASAQEPEEPSS